MYKLIQDQLTKSTKVVKRLADNAFIPFCADNTDYQQFKVDIEAGAELLDAEGNVIDGLAFVATLKVIKTIP